MLKPYDKPEDVPEALREHYSRREDGKMHADIPNDHPAVKHNATLLSEKNTAVSERDQAKADLASAQASGLPRGHVAVPKADADLLEKVKAAGTPEQVTEMIEKYPTLAAEVETTKREKHAADVGDAMGWDKEKTALLVPKVFDLSQVEVRTGSDGKKSVVAKVKQADGVTFAEKPFAEIITQTPELNALAPSLAAAQGGTKVLGSAPGSASTAKTSIVDEFIKERDAKDASKPSPFNRKTAQAA